MTNKAVKTQANPLRWWILVAIGIFAFMSNLDASIVNIALPVMARNLVIPLNQVEWVVSVYLVLVSALLLLFGRLGDLYGKNLIFRIGTVVFVGGSIVSGLNLGFELLLVGRAIQAVGAAMTLSNTYGIVTSTFSLKERGRAMGFVGTFVSLGAVTGPGLGGLILAKFTWPMIFWINVPIGIIAIGISAWVFPKPIILSSGKVDWLGSILAFVAIVGIFGGIFIGQQDGYSAPLTLILFALGIIGVIWLVLAERRVKTPLVPLKIFQNQLFSLSILAAFLIFMVNFFTTVLMPFYLEEAQHDSAGLAGLLLIVLPIILVITGPIGGYLADKWSLGGVQIVGTGLITLASGLYWLLDVHTSVLVYLLITAVLGIGLGLFQSPNSDIVMSVVDKSQLGIAGSINALARNLGYSGGSAIATTLLFLGMSLAAGQSVRTYIPAHPEWFIAGMHWAFTIAAVLGIVALWLSVRIVRGLRTQKLH